MLGEARAECRKQLIPLLEQSGTLDYSWQRRPLACQGGHRFPGVPARFGFQARPSRASRLHGAASLLTGFLLEQWRTRSFGPVPDRGLLPILTSPSRPIKSPDRSSAASLFSVFRRKTSTRCLLNCIRSILSYDEYCLRRLLEEIGIEWPPSLSRGDSIGQRWLKKADARKIGLRSQPT